MVERRSPTRVHRKETSPGKSPGRKRALRLDHDVVAPAPGVFPGIFFCALFVGAIVVPCCFWHYESHHVLSLIYLSLITFNAVNVLICLWEVSLYFNHKKVRAEHRAFKRELQSSTALPSPLFLFKPLSWRRAFSLDYWTVVWSTYSQLHDAYADNRTFGFWVDSGNGVTTILPSLLLSLAFTDDSAGLTLFMEEEAIPSLLRFVLQPRFLAMLGACMYWQEMYGTFVYFATYVYHRKFLGHPAAHIAAVVGANGIWIVFPSVGLYVMWTVIESGSWVSLR